MYHLLGKRLSSLREDRNLEEENCCCEDDNGNGTSDDEDGTGDDDEDGTSPSPTLTMTAIPSSEPTAEPTRPRIDVVSDAMFAIFSGFGIDSSVLTATTYCNWDGVTCNGIEPIQMCCYRYNGSYDGTIATGKFCNILLHTERIFYIDSFSSFLFFFFFFTKKTLDY